MLFAGPLFVLGIIMPKVFIVCSGLGRVFRGYESFTRECFDALAKSDLVDASLFKGSGQSCNKETVLWSLPRSHQIPKKLSRLFRTSPYLYEQLTFAWSLYPHIAKESPDVVLFCDEDLGAALWHWRKRTKRNFKLLFSNAGPTTNFGSLTLWDHIQQIAPIHLQNALNNGIDRQKQTLLPMGHSIANDVRFLNTEEREGIRRRLNLPEKRPLMLSVGAIDKHHKRMHYLINEIAQLPEPRPYLLLLGQITHESKELVQQGNSSLGADNFAVRTVPSDSTPDFYRVADCFALASVKEGLPRVLPEAMSYGLPCLAHDYEIAHYALGELGYFGDFYQHGALAENVSKAMAESSNPELRTARHRFVYNRFSWDKLLPDYVTMIQQCASLNQ